MQSVQQLVNRFYHGIQDHYSIILIGLDNAGKTSLLYLLKEGKLVVTFPTVGFNVETVRPPIMSRSGTTLRKGPAEVTVCDASIRGRASQDYFLALRMFAGCGDAVVWMVSSAESDRFQDSVEELRDALKRLEENENASQKPKPKPLLILANKQDLPGAESVKEIRSVFAGILTKRPWSAVLPTSLEQGLGAESGIPQAFDWLQNAIKLSRERQINPGALTHRVPSLPPHRLQELNVWFSRLKEDVSPDEFLRKQFESFSVLRWDHYSKIRVMFHLLQKYGRQEGEQMITKRLDKYRSLGPDALSGEVLSVTMTSFWIQIVHFAIVNDSNPAHSASFTSFIATNPHIINEELWMEYYSQEVMMSQKARDGIVLPDKGALPSIIFRNQGSEIKILRTPLLNSGVDV